MKTREHYKTIFNLHDAQGNLAYGLEVFGDVLAKKQGYKSLDGIDAIHYYLINKFNWLPAQVRGMSYEDLRFILSEEMHGFTLPPEAVFPD